MFTRIKRLPVFIANQIAAGEVIERPASVVKELLENALDAKASQINIEIGFGGLNLIKVSDNGLGILSDDLPLAIAPHATSKINQLADLYAIQSMGFRGEALASISSVSRMIICSRPASQEQAMRLDAVNQALSSCARNQGTTIEVHDIFFNAPVRKKFLKSERGEFQAIEMMVKRIAMSAPHVAMSLTHNGQLLWQLSPALCKSSMRARITKLLGKKFLDGASHIEVEHAGMQLEGWLGDVNYQRSQNDGMWIYLNNRMVKDKLLNHAIKQAYTSALQPGRYPVCLLYLTVNPTEVDVNVHPTKHEVRFQQARLVHDFVVSQVSGALEFQQSGDLQQQLNIHDPLIHRNDPRSSIPGEINNEARCFEDPAMAMNRELPGLTHSLSMLRPSLQVRDIKRHYDAEPNYLTHSREEKQIIALDQQFSLIVIESEVYLVDLVALRRHWFLEVLQQEVIPWSSRPLLVPVYYRDASCEFNDYQNHYLLLQQLGFELEVLDSTKLAIRSLPSVTPQLDINSFLQKVFLLATPELLQLISIMAESFSLNQDVISQSQQAVFWDYLMNQLKSINDPAGTLNNSAGRDVVRKSVKKISSSLCQELLYA